MKLLPVLKQFVVDMVFLLPQAMLFELGAYDRAGVRFCAEWPNISP